MTHVTLWEWLLDTRLRELTFFKAATNFQTSQRFAKENSWQNNTGEPGWDPMGPVGWDPEDLGRTKTKMEWENKLDTRQNAVLRSVPCLMMLLQLPRPSSGA